MFLFPTVGNWKLPKYISVRIKQITHQKNKNKNKGQALSQVSPRRTAPCAGGAAPRPLSGS
jgi:hypothetical protein